MRGGWVTIQNLMLAFRVSCSDAERHSRRESAVPIGGLAGCKGSSEIGRLECMALLIGIVKGIREGNWHRV
jgi:hypothetical protein